MAGTSDDSTAPGGPQGLRRKLALSRAAIGAERGVRAFWPAFSLLALVLGAVSLGLPDAIPPAMASWAGLGAAVLLAALLLWGAARFRWPDRAEALARMDAEMPGRPLAALADRMAVGQGDTGAEAMWQAHLDRMHRRAAQARAVVPDLRLARLDPFGLRHIALLVLVIGMLFGHPARVGVLAGLDLPTAGGGGALATGPAWEGWIEPPRHTGRPTLYLADQQDTITVPTGSKVILRLYGATDALSVRENVSDDATGAAEKTTDKTNNKTDDTGARSFRIARSGTLSIAGARGASWQIDALPDTAPKVTILDGAATRADGRMSQPFKASDDYGVTGGTATLTLDLDRVDRRFGLAAAPEMRKPITLDLPLPVTGDRARFTETLIENLSKHPWAHMPVTLTMQVRDAAGQSGQSAPVQMELPARRFFDPLAAAVIEQRRDLLWSRSNGPRVAQILRALSWQPQPDEFPSAGAYLQLRTVLRGLEARMVAGTFDPQARDTLAEAMWTLAVQIEDGNAGDALKRMQQAQKRLSEAMKNGASNQEIARLMQELRKATNDYLRQKMREAERNGDPRQGQQQQGKALELTQQDLQRMMDRIQDLMKQGRFAEAQQALNEFQRMMENMQVTQGKGGSGKSPGQNAMEGLADTLRQQQGLSDQAFRDLQEQFNPGMGPGQSQGNRGRNGGLGEGQSHDGQGGTGKGAGPRPGDDGNRQGGQAQGGQAQGGQAQGGQALADRQAEIRRRLDAQRNGLPGAGTEAGDQARSALDRANRAMQGAEDALRGNDYAGAIDKQAEAMEALREGMREVDRALAERNTPGGQGTTQGQSGQQRSDPLGRTAGAGRTVGQQDDMLQGEDVYRRARELLDEIRRRAGQGERPQQELDYLRRLLDQF